MWQKFNAWQTKYWFQRYNYDIFKKLSLKIVVVNLPKKCKFWFTNRISHYNEDNWYVHCNMLRLWENKQLIGAYINIQNMRYDSSTFSKNGLSSFGIIQSAAIRILEPSH